MKTKKDKAITEEVRDRYTISFRPKKVNKPINEMINGWRANNESPTDKIVEILIQERKLSHSSQARKFKSVFSSIYNSLIPAYEEDSPELYAALDEILNEILNINAANLFDLIQSKIDNKTMPNRNIVTPVSHQESQPVPSQPVVSSVSKPNHDELSPLEEKDTVNVNVKGISIETVKPKPTDKQMILVNGVPTELIHVPDKPKVAPQPESPKPKEESTDEFDFLGNAGIDFFSQKDY